MAFFHAGKRVLTIVSPISIVQLEVVTQNHFMFSMLEVFRKLTKNEFCTAQHAVIAAQPETKTVMPWHKPVNVSQINVEGEHHPYPVVSSAQRKEAFGSQKHLYTAEVG